VPTRGTQRALAQAKFRWTRGWRSSRSRHANDGPRPSSNQRVQTQTGVFRAASVDRTSAKHVVVTLTVERSLGQEISLTTIAQSDALGPQRFRIGLEHAVLKEATAVIVERHYLRRGRTMAQMAYWITFDGVRCGVVLFALPRMSSTSSKFGGHSPMQVVELARLWIDPAVQNRHVLDRSGRPHSLPIASAAISRSLKRIRQDWHGKYPHLPELLACVAWADQTLHDGTIYKAANFQYVGQSGGAMHRSTARPNGGRDQLRPDYLNVKLAYFHQFRRPLTLAEKEKSETSWASKAPQLRSTTRPQSISTTDAPTSTSDDAGTFELSPAM
jgi:hypothetical protein